VLLGFVSWGTRHNYLDHRSQALFAQRKDVSFAARGTRCRGKPNLNEEITPAIKETKSRDKPNLNEYFEVRRIPNLKVQDHFFLFASMFVTCGTSMWSKKP
jgi:hypothetical protein